MRRASRLWIVALAIPVILSPLAGAAGEPDVTGTWSRSFVLKSNEVMVITLVLKQNGETVTGTWLNTGGNPETIREGRVSKDQITFQIESLKAGGLVKGFYSGTVQGDSLELGSEVHLRGKVTKGPNTTFKRVAR
jgi:hypothetical protein